MATQMAENTEEARRTAGFNSDKFALFVSAYVTAIIFTDCNCDNAELKDKTEADFSDDMNKQIMSDCEAFYANHRAAVDWWPTQAGHDFWLTRNHHGAGFWDGEWPENLGERLTEAAHTFKEVDVYLGDDGKVYLM